MGQGPRFGAPVIGIINDNAASRRAQAIPMPVFASFHEPALRNKSSFVGGYLRHGERFAPWFTGQSWWTRSRTMSGDRPGETEREREREQETGSERE